MDEERERPTADLQGRRTFIEDEQLETREGGDLAIVLFRKSGTDGPFGFAIGIEEPPDSEEPVEPEAEVWASVISSNLDEAVSSTSRGSRDRSDERIYKDARWVW